MIRIAIVEDCRADSDLIVSYIKKYSLETGEEVKWRVFCTADEFVALYDSADLADVIFMDIEMPGINGMEAAERLRAIDAGVFLIFVTNIAQYAVRGYRVDAMDYFIKPIGYPDFRKRMLMISARKRTALRGVKKIKVTTAGGARFIPVRDIFYIESDNHVLTYHTAYGIFSSREKSMKQLEGEIGGYGFTRCNVCYLVNLEKCVEICGDEVTVGSTVLSISRGRRKKFIDALAKSIRI